MAQALPAIAAISAVVGAGAAVYSGIEQAKAAEEAEKIAEKNAQMMEAETAEQAKRLAKEQDRTEGLTRAMAAASGVGGESQQAMIEDMERTHAGELAWMKKAGASRASITRQEGGMMAQQGRAAAMGTMASGAAQMGGAMSGLHKTGVQQGWWGQ